MNFFGWGKKDPLVDMKLEDYLAKYPKMKKGGLEAEEIEKHASACIEIDGHKMLVYKGNITKLHIDAIQNAANSSLMGGGGIDGAIHDGAGYSIHEECSKLGGCKTGNSKITKGYDLPCATVIHTVGPIYDKYTPGKCSHELRSCYKTSLELCDKYKLKSIGLCCVSCGIYGYPLDKASHIAFNTVLNYLKDNKSSSLKYVIFVVFLAKEHDVYKEIFEKYNKGEYKEPVMLEIETPKVIARRKKEEKVKKIDNDIERKEKEIRELHKEKEKLLKEMEEDDKKEEKEAVAKVTDKEKEKEKDTAKTTVIDSTENADKKEGKENKDEHSETKTNEDKIVEQNPNTTKPEENKTEENKEEVKVAEGENKEGKNKTDGDNEGSENPTKIPKTSE